MTRVWGWRQQMGRTDLASGFERENRVLLRGDRGAVIDDVGGQRAAYLLREDAVDRDAKLRATLGFPSDHRARWSKPGGTRWGR